ncbi:MAG: hypothetical protein ACK4SM_00945 [Aquificaceae bacterium]
MEYFLIAPLLVLLAFVFYEYIRDRLEYYRSLGAEVIGYRYLINPVVRLPYRGMDIILFTEGPRGMHSLVAQLPVDTLGYMRLRKRDILDKILFQKKYKDLALEYEDEAWVNRLFETAGFEELVHRLFEEFRINWLEIKGNLLRIGWYIKREPGEVGGERLLGALSVAQELLNLLKGVAPSENYREDLRNWLTFKLPVALAIFLSVVGILGGFYKYSPTCSLNMLFVGFKLLFPIILFYLIFCLFMVGGATMTQRVLLKSFLVLFSCAFFINLFFLTYVNGML